MLDLRPWARKMCFCNTDAPVLARAVWRRAVNGEHCKPSSVNNSNIRGRGVNGGICAVIGVIARGRPVSSRTAGAHAPVLAAVHGRHGRAAPMALH